MNAAAEKVLMLRRSRSCLFLSFFGLVPLVGLPFVFVALWFAGQVRVLERRHWNVARPYRIWGVLIATFTTLIWLGVAVIIAINVISNSVP